MEPQAPLTGREALEAVLLDPEQRARFFAYARSRFGISADDAQDLLRDRPREGDLTA